MRLRVALAILLGLMTLPASAGAYVIGGRPWPGHRIAYFNADKQMARAVALAVHAWNTSGAHVRLVAAPRKRARVIIVRRATPSVGPALDEGTCFGYGDLGYQPRVEHIDLAPSCRGLIIPAAVAAHELGHILGLNHPSRGCATMTPLVWQGCPFAPHAWQYRCRFVQPDDVRGAIRLYGGRVRPHPSFCTAFNAPSSASGATVSNDISTLTWHNPSLPRVQLAGIDKPQLRALYAVNKDSCPNTVATATPAGLPVSISPGRDQTVSLISPFRPHLSPGTYCASVFIQDQYSRFAAPATTMFTVPNQPPAASFNVYSDFDPACPQFEDASTDSDGNIAAWQWDFGAPDQPANTSNVMSPSHCYERSGTYTVTLTVTDDAGAKATASQPVTVNVPPPAMRPG